MSFEQHPAFGLGLSDITWALTTTLYEGLVLLGSLARWYARVGVAFAGQPADLPESRTVDKAFLWPRQALAFLAALLAISLIDAGPGVPEAEAASVVSAATEFVRDRTQIELPRIITWRPLPVTTPAPSLRAHPRAVSTPAPERESDKKD